MEKEKITVATVDKLAHLSQLSLSAEERKRFVGEISGIVEMLDKCGEVKTGDVKENLSSTLSDLREDVVREGLSNADALKNAPVSKQGYFGVPKVVN